MDEIKKKKAQKKMARLADLIIKLPVTNEYKVDIFDAVKELLESCKEQKE